ncbi:MAG: sugar nucleotide-binding protein [Bacteroidota bacterium]
MVKQKILVTGADGQLGKELQMLPASWPQYDFIFLSRKDMPVDQAGQVKDIFKIHQPQYCINCAAYTAVDKAESEKEMAFHINADAAGSLAAVCKRI